MADGGLVSFLQIRKELLLHYLVGYKVVSPTLGANDDSAVKLVKCSFLE